MSFCVTKRAFSAAVSSSVLLDTLCRPVGAIVRSGSNNNTCDTFSFARGRRHFPGAAAEAVLDLQPREWKTRTSGRVCILVWTGEFSSASWGRRDPRVGIGLSCARREVGLLAAHSARSKCVRTGSSQESLVLGVAIDPSLSFRTPEKWIRHRCIARISTWDYMD